MTSNKDMNLSSQVGRRGRVARLAFGALPALLLVVAPDARSQTSASFQLKENVFNSGGTAGGPGSPQSASFRIGLSSVGQGLIHPVASSASFKIEGGFVTAYPPPVEVENLQFAADRTTLTWNPERSAGTYDVYRGPLNALSGLGYGSCLQGDVANETASDASVPPASTGYFYLVTAKNRLGEEGTKGFDSAGTERPNPAPCP